MTARTDTAVPVSRESRLHLTEHRDELHALSGSLDQVRADLRTDMQRGMPIDPDTLRVIRDAGDLLLLAARRLDPDQEADR